MGARLLMVIGESGTGKSSSLRYVNPDTTIVLTPNTKEFPVPGLTQILKEKKNLFVVDEINRIGATLKDISAKAPKIKTVVIEDLNHFFNTRVTSTEFRARNSGGEVFARWNDFGADVAANFVTVATQLRDDLTIVLFAHTDIKDDGKVGMKTSGKLLDNTINIPSYITTLLHSLVVEEGGKTKYKFLTNWDGLHLAKSPAGMFPDKYIPNDLNYVLEAMDKYKTGNVKAEWIE